MGTECWRCASCAMAAGWTAARTSVVTKTTTAAAAVAERRGGEAAGRGGVGGARGVARGRSRTTNRLPGERSLRCSPPPLTSPDVRILAHDPSELLPPGWSEQERYFFTCKEAKYVKGRRANRVTGGGFWKAAGKEKQVAVSVPVQRSERQRQAVVVGMKRSLVF